MKGYSHWLRLNFQKRKKHGWNGVNWIHLGQDRTCGGLL